jgi:hypothetical protein
MSFHDRLQLIIKFFAHWRTSDDELPSSPMIAPTDGGIAHPLNVHVRAGFDLARPLYGLGLRWLNCAGPLRIGAAHCIVAL